MAGVADHKSRQTPSLFSPDDTDSVSLELTVVDQETVDELRTFPDGPEREAFALNALRIGVLALRQARGRVDADLIQRETARMLSGLQSQLSTHAAQMHDKLAAALKEYFDPQSGRFHERVQQLVKPDGELEQLLYRQVGREDSELAKTLVGHFGQESPLMKLLSPDESQGLLRALGQTLETRLEAQRNHVLREFSLDNKEGALARMVRELTTNHGQLTEVLEKKIDTVVDEFTLDKEDSALSRLVRNVDRAQRTITREFSLDDETSALSRMSDMLKNTQQAIDRNLTLDSETSSLARLRRELFTILEAHSETNKSFQEEVKVALGKMTARREEAELSTRHGLTFEDAVLAALDYHTRQTGDIATRTGLTTGLIRGNKKGDCVVELGPDCAAAGAKVVVEAKEHAGFSLSNARAEIEEARRNRGAQTGLFVFSRRTAPDGIPEVDRVGNDVFIVWDPEDATTNLHLKIGLTLARALCIRVERFSQSQDEDFRAVTKAILEIEKQAGLLGEITTTGETIKKGAEKVLDRVRKTRNSLERQVEVLQSKVDGLKRASTTSGDV